MKLVLALLVLLSTVGLALLGPSKVARAQSNPLPAGVEGAEWKLVAIQRSAQDTLNTSNAGVTLRFDDKGLATGNSPCNSYSAPYQSDGGNGLTFGTVGTTLRACVDTSLMNLESEYYKALSSVTTLSLNGSTLRLEYNNGGSALLFSTSATLPGMPVTGTPTVNYGLITFVSVMLVSIGALQLALVRREYRKYQA